MNIKKLIKRSIVFLEITVLLAIGVFFIRVFLPTTFNGQEKYEAVPIGVMGEVLYLSDSGESLLALEVNKPLGPGDHLVSSSDGKALLTFFNSDATLEIDPNTSIVLNEIGELAGQLYAEIQLIQGKLKIHTTKAVVGIQTQDGLAVVGGSASTLEIAVDSINAKSMVLCQDGNCAFQRNDQTYSIASGQWALLQGDTEPTFSNIGQSIADNGLNNLFDPGQTNSPATQANEVVELPLTRSENMNSFEAPTSPPPLEENNPSSEDQSLEQIEDVEPTVEQVETGNDTVEVTPNAQMNPFLAQRSQPAGIPDGTWYLVSYGYAGNQNPIIDGSNITLNYSSKSGKLAGNSGCNLYSGKLEENSGDVQYQHIHTTRMICSQALFNQEDTYLRLLEEVNSYQVLDAVSMVLYTSTNQVLTFSQTSQDNQDPDVPNTRPTIAPTQPAGNAFYVSRAGNNSDGKTWATAWKDLDQINWSAISPGATIYVGEGTYTTSLRVEKSGTSGHPITITGVGKVVVDGPGSGAGVSIRDKQYVVVSGLEFTDWENAIYISGSSGKTYSSSGASKYIVIRNNKMYAIDGKSIFIQTSDHITIRKNTVTTPGLVSAQTDGIYSQRNHQNTYEGNTIIISNQGGGHNDGIQLYQDTNMIIRNNYIEQDNDKVNDAQGIFAQEMEGTTRYYNNVVNMTNVKSNSITFKATGSNGTVEIVGNTVYGIRPYHGIWVVDVSNPIVKNNIVYLENGSELDLSGSSSGVSNNFTSNPNFVSIANKDFRLRSSSPAIDAGVSLAAPYNVDMYGTPRPKGNGWDIGALEYALSASESLQSSTATPVPTDSQAPTTPPSPTATPLPTEPQAPTATLPPAPTQVSQECDYYVSVNGSDGNNGMSENAAWRSIGYAESHAGSSSTICVLAGDFLGERVEVNHSNLTFKAIGNVHVQGFDIETNSHDVTINGFKIHDTNENAGVRIEGDNAHILKNEIWHTGQGDGVWFLADGAVIEYNYIHDPLKPGTSGDPHADCFQTWTPDYGGSSVKNTLIQYNVCDHTRASGSNQFAMIETQDGPIDGLVFRGNEFYSHDRDCVDGKNYKMVVNVNRKSTSNPSISNLLFEDNYFESVPGCELSPLRFNYVNGDVIIRNNVLHGYDQVYRQNNSPNITATDNTNQ